MNGLGSRQTVMYIWLPVFEVEVNEAIQVKTWRLKVHRRHSSMNTSQIPKFPLAKIGAQRQVCLTCLKRLMHATFP